MQKDAPGSTITVPVPEHKEIRIGTLQSIIRQSQLPRALFEVEPGPTSSQSLWGFRHASPSLPPDAGTHVDKKHVAWPATRRVFGTWRRWAQRVTSATRLSWLGAGYRSSIAHAASGHSSTTGRYLQIGRLSLKWLLGGELESRELPSAYLHARLKFLSIHV